MDEKFKFDDIGEGYGNNSGIGKVPSFGDKNDNLTSNEAIDLNGRENIDLF